MNLPTLAHAALPPRPYAYLVRLSCTRRMPAQVLPKGAIDFADNLAKDLGSASTPSCAPFALDPSDLWVA